jgi:NDP-sugar pyrophosphorylase family protein
VPAPVTALVLSAGLGTRLQPLTLARAKPAMPVGGTPLIRRILSWFRASGVTRAVLNLHHLPDTLTAVVGDGSDLDLRVSYSWEQPVVLGSAGGPRQALSILGDDTFYIVNGDTLADMDLAALAADHERSGALVTLALTPNREPDKYGGVRLDAGGAVTGFVPRGAAEASFHFFGVQIAGAGVFRTLPQAEPARTVGGVYDDLIHSRTGTVRGFVCAARSWDIGTPMDYWTTSQTFLGAEGRDSDHGRDVRIASSARVTRSILWDEVEVGAGAVLDECIVTDGVRVPPGAVHCREMLVLPKEFRAIQSETPAIVAELK